MLGELTRATRISFGAMSTIEDLIVLVKSLEEFYLDGESVSGSPGAGWGSLRLWLGV